MDSNSDNITFRKPSRSSSLTDVTKNMTNNNTEKTILDTTMMSIPDSFHDTFDDVRELTEENKILRNQLLSAHKEIEDLNTENFRLKSDLQDMIKTVNTFKKICSTPEKKSATPTRKTKTLQRISSPNKVINEHEQQPTKTTNKQNKETQTTYCHTQTPNKSKGMPTAIAPTNLVSKPTQKNKLCILSYSNIKGCKPLVEEVFSEYFHYCHYIMPNCTIMRLISGIEQKLKDFTLNDYCLLFIGEDDINTYDNNYIDVINMLNESLRKVSHTNVVICLPTYKIESPIYNFKVEMFNNLLHLDNQSHKYAYIFDSNRDLTLEMFSYTTGRINKHGMRNIYDNIMSNILIDLNLYCLTNSQLNSDSSQETVFNSANVNLKETSNFFRVQ